MATMGTVTIHIADIPVFKRLTAALDALIDKLDDPPEGSSLDREWIDWVHDISELRDVVGGELDAMRLDRR